MGIDQYRRGIIAHVLLAINQRVAIGRHHFDGVGTGFEEQLFPTLCAALNIGFALRVRTDAGDADERKEFFEKTGFVLGNVVLNVLHGGMGD